MQRLTTALPLTLVFMLLGLVQYLYFPARQHDKLTQSLHAKAEGIAALAAYTLRAAIEVDDSKVIADVFRGLTLDRDVLYVAVYRRDGSRVASISTDSKPRRVELVEHDGTVTELRDGYLHVQTAIDLWSSQDAFLLAGFSTERIKKESQTNREMALLIGLAIAGVGLLTALWIGYEMRRVETNQLARRKAEAHSQSKSEFLANMSHELRTPLNAVIGMSQLLLRTKLTERQQRYGEAIKNAGEVLLALISDVLDFSKIEAGKLELEHEEFALREMLDQLLQVFWGQAHSKELELIGYVAPDVPNTVIGDSLRLRQIVNNLVSNAIKFTKKGQVEVRVECAQRGQDSALLHWSVSDSGIGMTPQQSARLFQSFTQGDSSISRRYGGTGLGLAISKQLTELMGGEIHVKSVSGQGSSFSFSVRVGVVASSASPIASQPWQDRRVLIAHGNERACSVLAQQLSDLGLDSAQAASGAAALDILRSKSPIHAMIVDEQLPDMTHSELIDRMARTRGLALPSVIVLQSLSEGSALRGSQSGAHVRGVQKPLYEESLRRALRRAFGFGSASSNAVAALSEEPPGARQLPRLGLRVLVAEDNPVNQDVIVGMLELLECHADVVADGARALAALKQPHSYAAALLDCQMPELDGYSVAHAVREHEAAAGLPHSGIIALTAHATDADRKRALDAGMDEHLTKPVDMDALANALQRWGDRRAASPARPTPQPALAQVQAGAKANPQPTLVRRLESSSETEGPLQLQVVERLRKLQSPKRPTFFRDLVVNYIEDSRVRVAELEQAVDNVNAWQLAEAAHVLKGSSRNIGAARLAELCSTVEHLGRRGQPESARDLVTRACLEFTRVETALGRLLRDTSDCQRPNVVSDAR